VVNSNSVTYCRIQHVNGRLRGERLNVHQFISLAHTQVVF